jgi:hypothetical protein
MKATTGQNSAAPSTEPSRETPPWQQPESQPQPPQAPQQLEQPREAATQSRSLSESQPQSPLTPQSPQQPQQPQQSQPEQPQQLPPPPLQPQPPLPEQPQQQPPQSFSPPLTPPPPQPANAEQPAPTPSIADLLLAVSFIILGFCFWEWRVLSAYDAGLGTTVFFLLALIVSFVYLQARGARQNARSLLMLLVAVAGSVPFILNGSRDINIFLLLFEACACLLWVMYSCRTSITGKVSGLLIGDLLNQIIVIPFSNFGRLFAQAFGRTTETRKIFFSILLAVVGVIVCIPIFFLVIWLLAQSDDGFRLLTENIFTDIRPDTLAWYVFDLIFGIPLAAYLFGAVFGNALRRHISHVSSEGALRSFNAAHVLPRALLYTPLALFVLLYIVYFIAMGSYLFSGLWGELPAAYTYAEYARRGFFELCTVATINLFILAGIWLFARRGAREYPPALRALSGLLALLTCLLIITAASKMFLYIQVYGLTPLRLYTSWFMALTLLTFLALIIWHIKPYNVARPIIVLVFVFTLGLGLTNTNGIIAEYNVERFLSQQTKIIDIETLASLGDPAVPALRRLQEESVNAELREEATDAIGRIREPPHPMVVWRDPPPDWLQWNLQSFEAARLSGSDAVE